MLEALFERGIWYRVYNQNIEVNLVLVSEDGLATRHGEKMCQGEV